jgi:hypothetical protein
VRIIQPSKATNQMTERRTYKKVISASRRVDLVAFYPDYLVQRLSEIGIDSIHTLVIWTKNPQNMLLHSELRKILKGLDQVYVLLTITGLGGTALEPGPPKTEHVLKQLPEIVRLIGLPERLAIRYDPLMDVIHQEKERICNIDVGLFEQVLNCAHNLGIKRIITSYVTVHQKVEKRLTQNGFEIVRHPLEEIDDFIRGRMMPLATKLGLELSTCVQPDLTTRGCIDGETLMGLHPSQERCSLAKDPSQRDACHCTKSLDIGQWFSCYHNCLYCYGNPSPKHADE